MAERPTITLEIEPIVKLRCMAVNCKNNLINAANVPSNRMAYCNLKQILIGNNGWCTYYEPVAKEGTE